jgi:hypothetical protein
MCDAGLTRVGFRQAALACISAGARKPTQNLRHGFWTVWSRILGARHVTDFWEVVLVGIVLRRTLERLNYEDAMRKNIVEKKRPCKNCEGKGTLKKGDKIVRCQRCGGTGIKS